MARLAEPGGRQFKSMRLARMIGQIRYSSRQFSSSPVPEGAQDFHKPRSYWRQAIAQRRNPGPVLALSLHSSRWKTQLVSFTRPPLPPFYSRLGFSPLPYRPLTAEGPNLRHRRSQGHFTALYNGPQRFAAFRGAPQCHDILRSASQCFAAPLSASQRGAWSPRVLFSPPFTS